MKGLILKDLYTLKKQFWFVIFYCILFAVYGVILKNTGMYTTMITLFLAIFPVTSVSYDERAGWDGYSVVLPVKRSEIVKSKYYLGYLFIIPTSIISLLINIIAERKINADILIDSLFSIIFALSSAAIMMAVLFPFMFKFGSEKGRIIIILVALLVGGFFGAVFVLYNLKDVISFQIFQLSLHAIAIIALILAVILSFVSILISIRIYEKKEF